MNDMCAKIRKEGNRRSLLDIWQKGQEVEFPMIIDEGNKLMYCELPKGPVAYRNIMSHFRIIPILNEN